MELNEVISFGFKLNNTIHFPELKPDRNKLSLLINCGKLPPFYLYLESIDATNGKIWQLKKGDVIICLVSNTDELEKAIHVCTCFAER